MKGRISRLLRKILGDPISRREMERALINRGGQVTFEEKTYDVNFMSEQNGDK